MLRVVHPLEKTDEVYEGGVVARHGMVYSNKKTKENSERKALKRFEVTPCFKVKFNDCCLLVDRCAPLFKYRYILNPGMPIRENTRNKSFKMISNWFIHFWAFLDQEYQ